MFSKIKIGVLIVSISSIANSYAWHTRFHRPTQQLDVQYINAVAPTNPHTEFLYTTGDRPEYGFENKTNENLIIVIQSDSNRHKVAVPSQGRVTFGGRRHELIEIYDMENTPKAYFNVNPQFKLYVLTSDNQVQAYRN